MITALDNSRKIASKPGVETRLKVCVVSANGCDTLGGLASYQRFLLPRLSEFCDVSAIARFANQPPATLDYASSETPKEIDHGAFRTRIVQPKPEFKAALRALPHLTGRTYSQPLAVDIYRRAYLPALLKAAPREIDVVHYVGNGWELLGYAAFELAKHRNASFTIWPAVHPGIWGDGSLDIALYQQADAIFAQTSFERDYLTTLGVDKRDIDVTGLGPACQMGGNGARFRATRELGARPIVLFIGRKERDKGYHALCQAMCDVTKHIPNACLVAMGPDTEPPYPHLANGVLCDLGRASETEKADALDACDLFCMPSRAEAFGIVFVEAWAYEKPVIGGPAPALRELITEGVNGYCVDQDPPAIADAIVRILSNSELGLRLASAGRARQQELFRWDKVANSHHQVFHRVTRERNERARECCAS